MWKLTPPAVDDAELDLLRALTLANGDHVFETSPEHRTALLQLYQRYDVTHGRPSAELLGAALGAAFVEAIYSAYDEVQERRRLAHLRDRLKAEVLRCPYCGFGEVTDLDHHLARSVYRALAIYCRNLIPSCHPCNNRKRTAGGPGPEEQFSHPYLDEYPANRFLVAQTTVSPQGGLRVQFAIVQCDGMADDVFARLRFQFSRLELNRRYEAQVVNFIINHRASIEEVAENGAEALREWLSRMRDVHERGYGLNDWRTALIESLLHSDEFCEGGFRDTFGVPPQVGA
jgi:hypothetical protein